MKTKFKSIVIASLLFGASGFNSAKAVTADELLVAVQQFAGQVGQAFTQVGQALGNHETRISDNEAKVTALESADVATDARIAALEAEPKANIAAIAPTAFDDINAGFTEGSVWVDMTEKDAYILVDSAPGAAIWKPITSTYQIGNTGPAGGIVFFTTNGGLHGLEAAPVDQATDPGAEWGCYFTELTGADGTAIGTGAQNTADILTGCADPGIAARLADDYSLNGFDDWYLPSRNEGIELIAQRAFLGLYNNGGSGYFTSSEIGHQDVWGVGSGGPGGLRKNDDYSVRAIRAF